MALNDDMEVWEKKGLLQREHIVAWLNEIGGDTEPLYDESAVNIGTTDEGARQLILKLLQVYRRLTMNVGDCHQPLHW